MKFNSQIQIDPIVLPAFSQDDIKQEPMLFRCDVKHASEMGGPITRAFLEALHFSFITADLLIDSRVHMLMPGMYPCIPGWHHDDVPRTRSDRQPNYETPEYKSQHCLALWGDCSLTEFALGEHELNIPPIGQKIYKELSPQVEALCQQGVLERYQVKPQHLVYFDWQSWHQGKPTTHRGFRFFIRATKSSGQKAANEQRYNANVYMPVIEEGW